jgi:hypothetical protein
LNAMHKFKSSIFHKLLMWKSRPPFTMDTAN